MDCIKYINDLSVEIDILKDLLTSSEKDKLEIEDRINRKTLILEKCKRNLEKLSDNQVCYRIYLNILNGMSVSKAIEKVADENYINNVKPSSSETIWKYYYPNLKKIINVQ